MRNVQSGFYVATILVSVIACAEAPATQDSSRTPLRSDVVPAAYAPPADSVIPSNDLGAAIRRGRALLLATRDSLPGHVGNRLSCSNCHLNAGTVAKGLSLVGVYARFPQYRSRSGRVNLIQERVNDCFQRSMNGKSLDPLGRDMADIVSYFAFISQGVPTGEDLPEHGLPKLSARDADTTRGRAVYTATCARCHGTDGQGIAPAPPLWGPHSFTIGAGLARRGVMSAFVRHNMPLDNPGSLTDQDAVDVAAFVGTHPRPDFAAKAHDWPRGDPPADAAYPTTAAAKAQAARATQGSN